MGTLGSPFRSSYPPRCFAIQVIIQQNSIEDNQAKSKRSKRKDAKTEGEKNSKYEGRPVDEKTANQQNQPDTDFSRHKPTHSVKTEEQVKQYLDDQWGVIFG